MSDVTRILHEIDKGDSDAAEKLLPVVYDELRRLAAQRLANESPGQTLQATALVHEAYVRLVDAEQQQRWDSQGHFFAAAAEAMRRILVENARRKGRIKHGGQQQRVELQDEQPIAETPSEDLLALDEALQRFEKQQPERAKLITLRYFAGLTEEQAAEAMGISRATASRYWTFGRAWLYKEIGSETDS